MFTYNNLYPNQKRLYTEIKETWAEGKPAVVVAGQRGGKTTICQLLAQEYAPAVQIGNKTLGIDRMTPKVAMIGMSPEYKCVIFEEAFWTSFSFTCFRKFLEQGVKNVLFIGNKSEYMEPWDEYVTSRYSTTMLVPYFDQEFVTQQKAINPKNFERDFGCMQIDPVENYVCNNGR
jgi:hypothetical protein